jgi:Tfp pilus assembly protein PilF
VIVRGTGRRSRKCGCILIAGSSIAGVAFRSRALSLLASAMIVAVFAAVPIVDATPYKPADDAQPLEQLPTAGNQTLRELRRLHGELAQKPEDLALALRVASRDIEAARSESDPRYNGYAEAALGPWLSAPKPPHSVLLLRAILRQAIHEFSAARDDLSRVISDNPRNVQARLTRATILQVQGLYDEALADCRSLALLADELVTTTCLASVYALHGRAKYGQQVLQAAIDRAPSQERSDIRLWALTLLAESEARIGDMTAAEKHFRQALSLGIRDVYLLGAYADFLLDAGRPAEVQALLKGEVRIDPLLLRLALAEQALGAAALSSHVADLAERFSVSRLRGDVSHQREEARFTLRLLNNAQDALQLAISNWRVQREPWDTRLLLEAALSTGATSAAQPALDWLAKAQLEDARLRQLASRLAEMAR